MLNRNQLGRHLSLKVGYWLSIRLRTKPARISWGWKHASWVPRVNSHSASRTTLHSPLGLTAANSAPLTTHKKVANHCPQIMTRLPEINKPQARISDVWWISFLLMSDGYQSVWCLMDISLTDVWWISFWLMCDGYQSVWCQIDISLTDVWWISVWRISSWLMSGRYYFDWWMMNISCLKDISVTDVW
jgi:hypothetical protein